jgi:hypothetical protein
MFAGQSHSFDASPLFSTYVCWFTPHRHMDLSKGYVPNKNPVVKKNSFFSMKTNIK